MTLTKYPHSSPGIRSLHSAHRLNLLIFTDLHRTLHSTMNKVNRPNKGSHQAQNYSLSSSQHSLAHSNNMKTRISTSTTPSLHLETRHPHSHMLEFLRKRRRTPRASVDTDTQNALKDKHRIDPRDGKTKACDRARTFDSFVEGDQLGTAKQQKKMGHSWDVVRALQKVKAAFGKQNKRTPDVAARGG